MEIYTNTPGVKQMREGVLEFLLINHPLDCPICDQAGECKLQEYSVEYGQANSRFAEEKVHKPKHVDLGPRIVLDDERCILCTRCIRFSRDIAGDDALGIVNRGSYNTLSAYPGKAFDNNYTLNTVDICPVGALTSKDFRFQMRVWFLKETKSVCTSCATGCNIVIGSREEKIYRYEPRENDAVNSCWMCDPAGSITNGSAAEPAHGATPPEPRRGRRTHHLDNCRAGNRRTASPARLRAAWPSSRQRARRTRNCFCWPSWPKNTAPSPTPSRARKRGDKLCSAPTAIRTAMAQNSPAFRPCKWARTCRKLSAAWPTEKSRR